MYTVHGLSHCCYGNLFPCVIRRIIILMRRREYRLLRTWLDLGSQERSSTGKIIFLSNLLFADKFCLKRFPHFVIPAGALWYWTPHCVKFKPGEEKLNSLKEGKVFVQQSCRKQSKWKSNLHLITPILIFTFLLMMYGKWSVSTDIDVLAWWRRKLRLSPKSKFT